MRFIIVGKPKLIEKSCKMFDMIARERVLSLVIRFDGEPPPYSVQSSI